MKTLSSLGLSFSLWWTSHRLWFRLLLLSIFFLINIMIWGLFSVTGVDVLQTMRTQSLDMQQMLATQVNIPAVHQAIAPKSLEVKKVAAINVGGGRSDVYAVLNNPNLAWAAKSLTYRFGNQGESRTSFVLAGEEKTLMDFLIEGLGGAQPTIEIANVDWIRTQGRSLPQTQFVVGAPELSAVVSEKEGTRARSTLLRFELSNRSPHHFFSVQVKTILKQGGSVIAINAVTLPKMLSQSMETISMSWPTSLPNNSDVEIVPEVNVLDDANLLVLPEGPKRTE